MILADDPVMFISEENYVVRQSEFRKIVNKYSSDEDTQYYMQRVTEITDNFFDPSINIEVVTLQSMIWNNVFKRYLDVVGDEIYFECINVKREILCLYELGFNNDISHIYHQFKNLIEQVKTNRIILRKHIKKMINYYPLYIFGFSEFSYKLNCMNFSLRDLYIALKFDLRKVTILYHKYKLNVLTTIGLCFRNNFGLPFNLKIEEPLFMKQMESYLF
jgi:hypothetical protein